MHMCVIDDTILNHLFPHHSFDKEEGLRFALHNQKTGLQGLERILGIVDPLLHRQEGCPSPGLPQDPEGGTGADGCN